MAALGKVPDWVALQTKVFTRWINQKFISADRPERIENVLTGFGDGKVFGAFLEALSETSMEGTKWNKGKMRVAHVDNVNMTLNYAKKLGINVKNFPQATDFIDGQERPVLGFVWACILKFLKFGDGDDSLNAKDALLMWVANKTAGYEGVKIEKFPNSFRDGLALCALLHSGRSSCITFDGLQGGDQAIEASFEGAEKYFQMEKFITVEEFKKFDEISMVVYVSDYYYGMARERKKDRAARRIGKVVKFTKDMDEKKAEFNARSVKFQEHIGEVQKVLGDRSIHNTMAGAVTKLEDFSEYKRKDKGELIGDQLNLESQYNVLATKLSDKNRPVFVPAEGSRLSDVEKTMTELEESESERNVALHNELNRQRKLLKQDKQHKDGDARLNEWISAKKAYLETKEDVRSVASAQLQLTLLSAYDTEAKDVQAGAFADLKTLGDNLESEKYERTDEVRAREAADAASFENLAALSVKKREVLDDDLAREVYRADIRVKAAGHKERYDKIISWVDKKDAYLKTRETIDNTTEAALQVALLEQYSKENKQYDSSHVAGLNKVGQEIRDAKYESHLSTWVYEEPEELVNRENDVRSRFDTLAQLHEVKKPIQADHLARELHRDKLRRNNQQHADVYAKIQSWHTAKKEYLDTRESIDNTAEAQKQLGILENYQSDYQAFLSTSVAALKALGQQINDDVYKTEHSTYVWEHPTDLKEREDATDGLMAELQSLHDVKLPIMQDHVAREQHKDRLRIQARSHSELHATIVSWYDEKEAYLKDRPPIDSVPDAQLQLSTLANYNGEKQMVSDTSVATLKTDGKAINDDVYKTEHSSYTWEDPQSLADRENDIDAKLANLDSLAATLKTDLDAALARELEKERLRLKWTDLSNSYIRWTKEMATKVSNAIFGYTLEEVQNYEAAMKADEEALNNTSAEKRGVCGGCWEEMEAIGIKKNIYCQETPETLDAAKASNLDAANSQRQANYKTELERQNHLDNLCKDFAGLVNSFSQWLSQEKDAVSKGQGSKEDQLAKVVALANDKATQDAKIGPIRDAEKKLEEAGVEQNRHTSLSSKDVEIQYEGFNLLLSRKTDMLKELIELEKLRGVTPEEWEEFNNNFSKFDKDGSDSLDIKEFKALMYSVGEELSKAQTSEVFEQYASGGNINRAGYNEYMVKLAGDSDTRDNVTDGFKLLSDGKEYCTRDDLARVMKEDDIEFIYKTIPAKDEGQDYEAWVVEVYSR